MYCTYCGEQLLEDAKFCHACGASLPTADNEIQRVPDLSENQPVDVTLNPMTGYDKNTSQQPENHHFNSSTTWGFQSGNSESIYTSVAEEAIKIFVGQNWHYYFRKWDFSSELVQRTVSWNWAAFFLTIYWAGYRKMYGLMGITLLTWVVLDILSHVTGLNLYLIGIVTSIIYGLYGNFLYYKFVNKTLEKNRDRNGDYPKHQLAIKGGTSGIGVFISIILVIVYAIISGTIYLVSNFEEIFDDSSSFYSEDFGFGSGQIQFGLGEENGYITNSTNEFSSFDMIYFSFDFPDGRGGDYQVIIEVVEGTNYIYDRWDDSVAPDWPGVVISIPAPMDNGEYVVKIIKDEEVIANGTFYVNNGYNGDAEEF